ncbi:MAG: hypothetical protein J6C05_05270 [Prevotella sp.]|nr:hypothetical protein [Prevotella sp.]MBO5156526.1 hypothetical protein [Prevotella sp.]
MRILLLGESSFVHSTLRKGFRELGHDVVVISEGNKHNNCPRDVDLKRNMRYGVFGGLGVLWKLLINARYLFGNDIVQIHNFQFVPLKVGWNRILLMILKWGNKKLVKCCWTDDPVVFKGQAAGMLRYSDTHIQTRVINDVEDNRKRFAEQMMSDYIHCCDYANRRADALLPCLYEYYVYYNLPQYRDKLYYMPLPMEIPETVFSVQCSVVSENKQLNTQDTIHNTENQLNTKHLTLNTPVKVLVGIQSKRDYMKGAGIIAGLVERVAAENPGKIEVKRVYDVPYNEYLKMLDEADVLVDQLYSYTPSMNSLAAMAHGTVVIGGGEEEYYEFIGEKTLRPIINVRPEDDEYNMKMLRDTLLYPNKIEQMKREGLEFVHKHHDYVKVAEGLIVFYEKILAGK